jgi:hypothetical protein
MTARDDDILDDLFLGCAFAAFIDQSIEQRGPPDMEATRRWAYRMCEQALAEDNAVFDTGPESVLISDEKGNS